MSDDGVPPNETAVLMVELLRGAIVNRTKYSEVKRVTYIGFHVYHRSC